MENDKLKEKLLALVPNTEFEENKQFVTVVIPAEKLRETALALRDGQDTKFDFLFCETAVDMAKHFFVVYHLRSTSLNHSLVLKVKAGHDNPAVDTVCDIWRTAEFHEREIWDLMGIKFNNHPDLRRIFLDENWKGHPLRKDYKDEVNIVEL